MSNIDKQWLQQKIAEMEDHRDLFPGDLDDDHASVLSAFRIALASLEAEAVVITDDMAYAFHHALSDSSLGADEVEEIKTGLRAAFANVTATTAPVSVPDDYFASLVAAARVRADKAMRKFPQPNYVLNKVAEESGEVIKAVIHFTEGREEWRNVEGEIIDNLAMLIRLVIEGDQVIGFTPPEACRATMFQVADGKPELTVWYGAMPETNGKTNWTAILHRKGECLSTGITIDRSEYPERVRYEADRVRYLIGESDKRPCIIDYDADAHSGYVEPVTKTYKLPPHVYRELVNALRDTAVKYQGCQQLREQISETMSAVITHTPHGNNPPAPVSVPGDVTGPLAYAYKELTTTFMRNHIDAFERYGIYPDGSAGIQAMRIALDGMERRAAMIQGAGVTQNRRSSEKVQVEQEQQSMFQGAENVESPPRIKPALVLDSLPKITESPSGNSPVIPDGWVACSERMPEGMTDVNISNGHDVGQGWWDGDTWQTQHDYYSVPGDVTHWMPLPKPPLK